MALGALESQYALWFGGTSSGAALSAVLVQEFAWSDRTTAYRNSQWICLLDFCSADGHCTLPATEVHFIAFIGWLRLAREEGTRNVGSASIPQYFSAVRRMHHLLLGTPVPSYPFLQDALRA